MTDRILYIPKKKKTVEKKSHRKLWLMAGILGVIFLGAGAVGVTRMRQLQITHISVRGLDAVSEQDLHREVNAVLTNSSFAGLIPDRFLLAAPLERIRQRIRKRFPLIADVAIRREFPDTLALMVRERTSFGIVCNDVPLLMAVATSAPRENIASSTAAEFPIQCAYLDTEGIAYQHAPRTQGFLITKISTDSNAITVGERIMDSAMIRRMIEVSEKINNQPGLSIANYQLLHNTPRELRIFLHDGFSLILNRDDNLDQTLAILQTVLEKDIGSRRRNLDYIDLRFGNKVFYKFR